MTEGWVECPALGPGWKRRETARKSGVTCGRTDTYYQRHSLGVGDAALAPPHAWATPTDIGYAHTSLGGYFGGRMGPTGEKFRSKVELSRFLGASRDLSNFDFKHGLELQRPRKPRKGPKWPPSAPPPLAEGVVKAEEASPLPVWAPPLAEATPPVKAEATPLPICTPRPMPDEAPPLPAEAPPLRRTRRRTPHAPPHGGVVACCAGCQSLFPGVTLGPSRRCRWLCPDCRARRREFNRQQRFYKRIGCGSCQACKLPTDCGLCSVCSRRGTNQGPGSNHALANKCLLRRCLRIVKKTLGCGSCTGCRATEDCGCCYICLRRLQPGLRRQWRCLLRRCLRPRTKEQKKAPRGPSKVKPEANSGGVQQSSAPSSGAPIRLPPLYAQPGPGPHLEDPHLKLLVASTPRLSLTPPGPAAVTKVGGGTKPPPADLGVLLAAPPPVKKELSLPSASLVPVPPRLPPPTLVVLDESEEEEDKEGIRVSLPFSPSPSLSPPPTLSPPPPPLPPPPPFPDTFLAELAQIPLPAHWGLLGQDEPPGGGEGGGGGGAAGDPTLPHPSPPAQSPPCLLRGLRLVQRSPRSPMVATVVLLAPGLDFRVLVGRQRPVPPQHEVLARRPPRLRSVDDLVELLCDLEAYRPCRGPPGVPPGVPPAPRCQVLVPEGGCCRPCWLLGKGGGGGSGGGE